ncbi:MAG TPA: serpin family protein [Chthoniobacterales bacterium]|nr:serpin family protein [Chthoniobacterales bacterium]
MKLKPLFTLLLLLIESACRQPEPVPTGDPDLAADATNRFGLDLYRRLAPVDENFGISPYSLETALVMTFAGADGATRKEMVEVLHLAADDDRLHESFHTLRYQLQEVEKNSAKIVSKTKLHEAGEPITLTVANQLFGQKGSDFREPFLNLLKQRHAARPETVDFAGNPSRATHRINAWIADRTHQRLRNVLPPEALNAETRLVVANAIYLKAQWDKPFDAGATELLPFHVRGGETANVPTMTTLLDTCAYVKHDGFVALSVPYFDWNFRFLILVPDDAKGLPELEARITPAILAEKFEIETEKVELSLPKFKFEPATLRLGSTLRDLGMATAFKQGPGGANFDRMAQPNSGLYLGEVFHKIFIAVDEKGTEAAGAGASGGFLGVPPEPVQVKIDRPFFYAIQHLPTFTCLFIGHVTDPR